MSNSTILGIPFGSNKEQLELIRLINTNDKPVIFCFGDAGTGKTFATLAASLDLIQQRKYKHIYYIREPKEVGRSLGFLPGNIDDKYNVYLEGLFDNIEHICAFSKTNPQEMATKIECMPPQFVRGRSFENSIIIVDEAQNLELTTIQTLLTRIGKYCKIILLGSMNQIDLPRMTAQDNDFKRAYSIIEGFNFVGGITLIKNERSEYAAALDKAFSDYKIEHTEEIQQISNPWSKYATSQPNHIKKI